MAEAPAGKAPMKFYVVAVVALVWNLVGAFDYVMTQTKNPAYMGQFSPEQLEYFYGFPAWFTAFWALAVWGGVLAAVLLLMRRKLAVTVFLISFLCMVVTSIYSYGLKGGAEIMGPTGLFFSVVIFVVALGLFLYSRKMARKGILV
jgi:hypothetical protein